MEDEGARSSPSNRRHNSVPSNLREALWKYSFTGFSNRRTVLQKGLAPRVGFNRPHIGLISELNSDGIERPCEQLAEVDSIVARIAQVERNSQHQPLFHFATISYR
jgi:hypothetical protein